MRVNEKNLIEDLEPALPLIYIDESGFQSDDTRFHSYSYIGTRAESTFNWQVKNSCNAVGANYWIIRPPISIRSLPVISTPSRPSRYKTT